MMDAEKGPLSKAGGVVWLKMAASVEFAESSMTPEEKTQFWTGLMAEAASTMERSIGSSGAFHVLSDAMAKVCAPARPVRPVPQVD